MIQPHRQHKLSNNTSGFTAIELIIYLSIVTIAALVFTSFMTDVTKNAVQSKISKEVQQNARFMISRITQEIRSATDIDIAQSILDNDHGKLSLITSSGTSTFLWNNERAVYDDGSGPVDLSTDSVGVTSLRFEKDGNAITVALTVQQKIGITDPSASDSISLTSTTIPRRLIY
ncbi:PilW family protein [Patescibacteria group bacterium]